MIAQSLDTPLAIEEVQLALIRAASTAKRIAMVRSLSSTTIQLSRKAIKAAHPHLSELETNVMFIEHHYGKKLAEDLSAFLQERQYG